MDDRAVIAKMNSLEDNSKVLQWIASTFDLADLSDLHSVYGKTTQKPLLLYFFFAEYKGNPVSLQSKYNSCTSKLTDSGKSVIIGKLAQIVNTPSVFLQPQLHKLNTHHFESKWASLGGLAIKKPGNDCFPIDKDTLYRMYYPNWNPDSKVKALEFYTAFFNKICTLLNLTTNVSKTVLINFDGTFAGFRQGFKSMYLHMHPDKAPKDYNGILFNGKLHEDACDVLMRMILSVKGIEQDENELYVASNFICSKCNGLVL
jgi:hypothetical protein